MIKKLLEMAAQSSTGTNTSEETIDDGSFSTLVFPILRLRTPSLNLILYSFAIDGLFTYDINHAYFDLPTARFHLKVIMPKLTCEGSYKMNGKMLSIPIKGQGNCKVTFEGGEFTYSFDSRLFDMNNHGNYDNSEFEFKLKSTHFNFEGLYGGESFFSTEMNKLMNENWREIIDELQQEIRNLVRIVADATINKYFSN